MKYTKKHIDAVRLRLMQYEFTLISGEFCLGHCDICDSVGYCDQCCLNMCWCGCMTTVRHELEDHIDEWIDYKNMDGLYEPMLNTDLVQARYDEINQHLSQLLGGDKAFSADFNT